MWCSGDVRIACCGLIFWMLAACASKEKNSPEAPKESVDVMRLVARVQSRPGSKDFVLLEAFGKWTVEDGVNLYAYGSDGRMAILTTSGEKLGQFVAADVKSGQVEIGDAVYHRSKGPSTTAEPAAAPTAPLPAPQPESTPAVPSPIEPVPLPSY
jgi:hypothetical protein